MRIRMNMFLMTTIKFVTVGNANAHFFSAATFGETARWDEDGTLLNGFGSPFTTLAGVATGLDDLAYSNAFFYSNDAVGNLARWDDSGTLLNGFGSPFATLFGVATGLDNLAFDGIFFYSSDTLGNLARWDNSGTLLNGFGSPSATLFGISTGLNNLAAPEPSTLLMAFIGISGLVFHGFRLRRRT